MDNNNTVLPAFDVTFKEELTNAEHVVLATMLSDPIVKKYLRILLQNKMKELVSIPLDVMATNGLVANAINQAFIKGNLSILYTLNTVEKPQPRSVQANQTQNAQQINP